MKLKYIKRYVKDFFYWLRCHTYNRYHFVDIRTKEYRWGWIDQDHRIFNACFNCLVEFVEKEDGLKHLEYQIEANDDLDEDMISNEDKAQYKEEATNVYNIVYELYHWWKTGREQEEDEINNITKDLDLSFRFLPSNEYPGYKILDNSHYKDEPKWLEYKDRIEKFEKNDDIMLDKLIKMRKHFWT